MVYNFFASFGKSGDQENVYNLKGMAQYKGTYI